MKYDHQQDNACPQVVKEIQALIFFVRVSHVISSISYFSVVTSYIVRQLLAQDKKKNVLMFLKAPKTVSWRVNWICPDFLKKEQ